MSLPALLGRVAELLDHAGVSHMITGSLAAAYHATPRATQDLDVVVSPSLEGLSRLAAGLAEAGFYVSLDAVREAVANEGQFNAIDPESGWKIDFIIRKSRPFSRTEFDRRRPARLLGVDVSLTTPEDLILAKLEWAKRGGSELQLRDVAEILRARAGKLDVAYIERWAGELGLEAFWHEVRQADDA